MSKQVNTTAFTAAFTAAATTIVIKRSFTMIIFAAVCVFIVCVVIVCFFTTVCVFASEIAPAVTRKTKTTTSIKTTKTTTTAAWWRSQPFQEARTRATSTTATVFAMQRCRYPLLLERTVQPQKLLVQCQLAVVRVLFTLLLLVVLVCTATIIGTAATSTAAATAAAATTYCCGFGHQYCACNLLCQHVPNDGRHRRR